MYKKGKPIKFFQNKDKEQTCLKHAGLVKKKILFQEQSQIKFPKYFLSKHC